MKQKSTKVDQLVDAAMAHLVDDEFDEANIALRDALEIEPENEVALLNLGIVLVEKGEYDEAESIFSRL